MKFRKGKDGVLIRGSLKGSTLFTFIFTSLLTVASAQDSLVFDPIEIRDERILPSDPYRVSDIDSSHLKDQAARDLGGLLEDHSGVQVRRYGPSGTASISFRGTRSNETRMYWNGLPLRSPTLGQRDLSLIPVFFMDGVELHHGGASAVDGTGGIGGSLHLRSGVEQDRPWRISIEGRGASFGDRMGGLDLVRNGESFQSRTRLFYRSADNDFPYPDVTEKGSPEKQRRNAGMERMGGMQNFRYKLGNGHRLFASGWYLKSSRKIPTPIDQVERGQEQKDRNVNSVAGWMWSGDRTELSLRSGYFFSDLLFTEKISDLRSETRTHSWRNRFQVEHHFDEKRKISGAWSYEVENARSSGYSEPAKRVYSRGYLQFENEVGEHLLLQALLQEEWVDGDRVPLMPSLGFDLDIWKEHLIKLKGNASKTYRVPTLNDLYWEPGGNPDLRPQQGWSYELGSSARFGKANENFTLRTELTAFLLKMDDRIVWAPTSTGYWSPKNIDRSEDRGLEARIGFDASLGEALDIRLQADHTYVEAQVIDQVEEEGSIEGKAIYVPPHRSSSSLDLIWKERNRLSYGVSYTGRRFIDRDNLRYLPSYTLQRVHLERIFALREDLRLQVRAGVRNLFDVPYHSVAWHPMPGRSFELTLRLNIGP